VVETPEGAPASLERLRRALPPGRAPPSQDASPTTAAPRPCSCRSHLADARRARTECALLSRRARASHANACGTSDVARTRQLLMHASSRPPRLIVRPVLFSARARARTSMAGWRDSR
jgi:hypothetical protein